jgi:hypothetical protein
MDEWKKVLLRLCLVASTSAWCACAGDAGTPPPDGGDASDLAPAPAPRAGVVSLESDTGLAQSFASASFMTSPPADACTTTAVGACFAYQCPPGPSTEMLALGSAGNIHIAGGLYPITLDPQADNSYRLPQSMRMMALWNGGETLTVSAGGGVDVPAFTAQVTAPSAPRISAPASTATGSFALSRAQDLVVTWSGGSGDTLDFAVSDAKSTTLVECHFPLAAGSGTVPSALLTLLPAGAGSSGASVSSNGSAAPSGWSISVLASSLALADDGTVYDPTLQIQ